MVGVAGRSRGCKTCRRRRVKCDEQHPTCKRCEKAGYTCEGYQDRNFIIFDNTIKHENAIQSYKTSPKHSSTNSASSATISDTNSESARDFNSVTPQSVSADLVKLVNHGSPGICDPRQEAPCLDRGELYSMFMWKYFYRGAEARIKLFQIPGADLNVRSSLAYMSSQALRTSFFGFKTGSQDIMIEGQRLYGSALLHLNYALSHRSPKNDCDVLAAIVMLCLFEFLMPASITGWISHALGLGGMFKVLGPELCSQYPYHTYFEVCRLLIIYAHLILRLDSFLADKKWLTIPWLTRVEGKTRMEEISDVLTQLCRVQCYWDDVVKQREQSKRDKFQQRYQKQLAVCFRELQNWASQHRETLEAKRTIMPYQELRGSILEDKEKSKSKPARSDLIQNIYNYPNLETANLLCLYHGIYILLTIMVHNPPPPTFVGLYPPPSPPPPADSPMYTAFLHSGLEIAKSTDFHLLEAHDSAGSFHLVFPMRMCARAFEEIRMKVEERWANGVLTSIARGSNRQWAFAGQIVRENGKDVHQFRR